MANKHLKRCATPLVIRGMQIKTSVRYRYRPPPRMAKTSKTDNIECEDVEPLELSHVAGRNTKTIQLWKRIWQFLIKLDRHSSHNPATLLLGIHPRERKTGACTETYPKQVYASKPQTTSVHRCVQRETNCGISTE